MGTPSRRMLLPDAAPPGGAGPARGLGHVSAHFPRPCSRGRLHLPPPPGPGSHLGKHSSLLLAGESGLVTTEHGLGSRWEPARDGLPRKHLVCQS